MARERTRAILRAQGREAAGRAPKPPDLQPFHALQQHLELAGERRVIVPFAETLAELIPAKAVRLRRDFRQLLTVVEAIAFLYQWQRPRTAEGGVVATLTDYGITRWLLAPIFDAIVAGGLTPALRQTVEAVPEGGTVSQADLARNLNLAPSTVSWRVGRCLKAGWLRRNLDGKITQGEPLPPADSALPTVTQLRAALRDRGEGPKGHLVRYAVELGAKPTGKGL